MELRSENTQPGLAMKIRQRTKVERGKLGPHCNIAQHYTYLSLLTPGTVTHCSCWQSLCTQFSGQTIQPAKRLQRSSSDLMLVMYNFGQAVSPLCASVSSSVQWGEEWYLFHKVLMKSQWAHTRGMTGLLLVHTGAQQVSPSSGSQWYRQVYSVLCRV